jgi:S1-C subfamily serine protease
LARIDEQRAALEKQGREQIAQLEKLREAYDATVNKHNQLVTLYQQKTNEGSTDAITIFDQIQAQRKVVAEAKTAIDLKSSEIEALGRQDEALQGKRKRYEDALTELQRRRDEERRKMGAAGSSATGGTPGGVAQAPAAGSQQARLVAGVMVLVVKDSGTGTGFVVSRDGLVVTNAHVVKSRNATVVAMWDASANRKPVRMRVIDFAEADDLALLKADTGAPFEALKLDEVYELQRPLVSAGFPLAGSVAETLQTSPSDIVVSRGILGSVRRSANRVEWLQHDCRVSSGNSGGPIIDQQSGAVIGVTTMVLETDGVKSHGDGINLAIPIRKVVDRFAAHLKP